MDQGEVENEVLLHRNIVVNEDIETRTTDERMPTGGRWSKFKSNYWNRRFIIRHKLILKDFITYLCSDSVS